MQDVPGRVGGDQGGPLRKGTWASLVRVKRFPDWPDADHGNRLVCISRDVSEEDIALTLPALNTPAGTQAHYSMQELRERYARQ